MEEIKEIKKNYEMGFISAQVFFMNTQMFLLNWERKVN